MKSTEAFINSRKQEEEIELEKIIHREKRRKEKILKRYHIRKTP